LCHLDATPRALSRRKHSRSSPCPPRLLNDSQAIPTPPLIAQPFPTFPKSSAPNIITTAGTLNASGTLAQVVQTSFGARWMRPKSQSLQLDSPVKVVRWSPMLTIRGYRGGASTITTTPPAKRSRPAWIAGGPTGDQGSITPRAIPAADLACCRRHRPYGGDGRPGWACR
jgi:hypothetical protein